MYAVAGLIQTLLMLTQAPFVPDMSGFWEQLSKPETVKPLQHKTVLLPADAIVVSAHSQAGILLNRDAELVLPSTATARVLYPSPRQTFPQGRMIATKRLYLIFCQLRIGG